LQIKILTIDLLSDSFVPTQSNCIKWKTKNMKKCDCLDCVSVMELEAPYLPSELMTVFWGKPHSALPMFVETCQQSVSTGF